MYQVTQVEDKIDKKAVLAVKQIFWLAKQTLFSVEEIERLLNNFLFLTVFSAINYKRKLCGFF